MVRIARLGPAAAAALAWLCLLSYPVEPAGTASGTVVENAATVDYTDGGVAQPTVTSNKATVTVTQVAGVGMSPATATQSSRPGGAATYAITITNSGNGSDDINASAASGSSPAWPATLYRDDGANGGTANDGIRQAGETNAATATGTLAADASFHCFLVVQIPEGSADSATDVTTVTATSQFAPQVQATAAFNTAAHSALVTLSKSVDRDSAAPGDTLVYTVTYRNTGSRTASNVVVTDTVPGQTSYVPNSVSLQGSPKTDAADADEVTVSAGTIAVRLGDLAPGAEGTFTFRVGVK
jgi:uncharacterized repeat protein (TIGR01451 family)